MRKLLWSALVLIACAPMGTATAQNDEATKSAQPAAGETVVLASQVLQRASKHGAKCKQLVLDLDTAHVALLTVAWQRPGQAEMEEAVVPWCSAIPDDQLDSAFWKELSRVPTEGINRDFVSQVYSSAKKEIYWSDILADAKGADKFDAKDYQLTTFSQLVGQGVKDKSGEPIGKIVDLGINDTTGAIVYCVLESSDSKFRAIPLAAFVASEKSKAWTIALDREQVFAFETCDLSKPPQAVDRGWQEYVAVKYGRKGLGQAETKKE